MWNILSKKAIVVGLFLLLIGAGIITLNETNIFKKSNSINQIEQLNSIQNSKLILKDGLLGNILYVGGSEPGNYTSIQDLIDDTVDGDTI